MAKLTLEELNQKLINLEMDEADLAAYFLVNEDSSAPFAPAVVLNPDMVIVPATASPQTRSALIMNGANWLARRRRQAEFHRFISSGDYDGPIIVDEGDSWFQYPILLADTIDVLMGDLAVFSLSAGGDTLSNMARKAEYKRALRETGAPILLLSAGGNDVVAGGQLAKHLRAFDPSLAPAEYLLQSFDQLLGRALRHYGRIFSDVTTDLPDVDIICHGYDHPRPDGGRWLGKPMESRGIEDRDLQADIARVMIDRFNDHLIRLTSSYPKVHCLDVRGVVDGRWHDELHPTNDGYRDVGNMFRAKILEITESAAIGAGVGRRTDTALTGASDPNGSQPKAMSLHIGLNAVDATHYGSEMPLDFCIADADAMADVAASLGYRTTRLTDAAADRASVIGGIEAAAEALGAGDIFLFTYAGHGGQLPDFNRDEAVGPDGDTLDETLCLYDGQIIDDELYRLWARFAEGVRIVTVFDCCHSGSAVRGGGWNQAERPDGSPGGKVDGKVRVLSLAGSARVYRNNRDFYDDIVKELPPEGSATAREIDYPVKASLIQLSACQSNQVARESFGHGLFTERILELLDRRAGMSGYREFLDSAAAGMPESQSPKYWFIGMPNPVFEAATPFGI